MAFFDDLTKNLTVMGRQATDKAKEVATITKLTAEIKKEEAKIEKLYAAIGKRVYEATKDAPAETDAADVAAITEAFDKIASLKGEVSVVKGGKSCPSCGAFVEDGSKFCKNCGAEIEADDAEEIEEEIEETVVEEETLDD